MATMLTALAPHLRRRSFLTIGGAAFASLLVQLGRRPGLARAAIYGELVPDPEGILDLPAGFSYRILDSFGEAMDDGYTVPALPDGMAVFEGPDDTLILMRNHELLVGDGPYPFGEGPPQAFDPIAMGCVTRVVLDGSTFERISSNLVLCGTLSNCAGGWSPWGWLSCEESQAPGHGYVFVCDPLAAEVQDPAPVPAFGRYKHEAACVNPSTGIVYLTEDLEDSCLYRFVPDDRGEPFVGRLQALRIVGEEVAATTAMEVGQAPVEIDWVDVGEPDPLEDTVRLQAQAKGAAVFVRGEGITFTPQGVYVVATTGGPVGKGQIFRLVEGEEGGTLEVVVASEDPELLDMPDNITMSPWGELFFCEDGSNGNFLRGVTPEGELFDFARNAMSEGELAGVCLSPDGTALFVNLQKEGMTLVITGPFPEAPDPGESSDSEGSTGDGSSTGGEESTGGGTDGATTGDPSDGSDAASDAGGDGDTSSAGEATASGGADQVDEGDSGCGCSTDADPGAGVGAALLAGVVAMAVKERQRGEE